jgi:hypothetical protein
MATDKIYLNQFTVKQGKYPDTLDVWIPSVSDFATVLKENCNSKGGINLRIVKKRIPPPEGKPTHYCEVNNFQKMNGGDIEIERKPIISLPGNAEEDEGLPF